ncbi:alpha/beta hydrolase [Tropicimonas marinistellae]|uniref:alpha/beta hydrolase n=1 Tax=Tropicimonas marinistellae TaxID=1739787 RepID=UPI000836BCF9|nr:alpha/beta hydrolase [Tropicimonas marinistellae]
MRVFLVALLVLVAGLAAILLWGPREPVDAEIGFDPQILPADAAELDGWLATREAEVPNLRPDDAKQIRWNGAPGARTPLAIVYLHGFSASQAEIRPVPDNVAAALGANLYFARLSGHGRDGPAMAEPAAGDWIADTAEALAIGRRIGERVLVISTSTGGTLAALAAVDPSLSEDLAGMVFVSPNFRIANPLAGLLTLPYARHWMPLAQGAERGFDPLNDDHAAHWTTRYPSVAAVPLAALVAHVGALDYAQAEVPALFVYSRADQIVAAEATDAVHDTWGGPVARELIEPDGTGDPANHLIAGDILSPGRTERVSQRIIDWASAL